MRGIFTLPQRESLQGESQESGMRLQVSWIGASAKRTKIPRLEKRPEPVSVKGENHVTPLFSPTRSPEDPYILGA